MSTSIGGWSSGLIGVLIFSASLPATRASVQDLDPVFVTTARASIAALLGLVLLSVFREARPQRRDLAPLAVVGATVVVGWPLLAAFALRSVTSAHAGVFTGLLPISTALFGVVRGGERPRPVFWLFAAIGSALVVGYTLAGGAAGAGAGDVMLLAGVVLCGLGYAEGGRLSRRLGGWQVISWALVLSLPVTLTLAFLYRPTSSDHVGTRAWAGLAYVSVFSMLIGFIFWYRGLAQGGIAAVGQLQLLQPFFGLGLAALLLDESVSWTMLLVTVAVVGCVVLAKRAAARPISRPSVSTRG